MKLDDGYYGSPRWSWEILDCAMPMTFDTYSNCAHQCVYCFAYFQRAVGTSADDYLHHKVRSVDVEKVKRMFTDPDQHAGQFAWYIKQRRVLQWGGLSDGFDWYERKFRKSLELLRFFREIEYPISISTKGVWWLQDPEYREVLQGTDAVHLKITIITDDAEHARVLEAGTPSPDERYEGLAAAAELGVVTTLRFRPYVLGISDLCDERMLRRAKDAGCYSATTEFLCIEGRSSGVAAERYRLISELVGYDVYRFYRMHSDARSGLLRLNYELKRPHIRRMQAVADEVDLPFFVSDAHHKEAGCGSGCCGLPETGPLSNSFRGQFAEAVQIAKANGEVRWSDISAEAEHLKEISFYRAEGYNAGSTRQRSQRRYQTMYDYMRETWNNTKSKMSPARHHGGVMVPAGVDEHGDVIYAYNEPWVSDGRRIQSVSELIELEPAAPLVQTPPKPAPGVGKALPMRVFIPTKNRAETIRTHMALEGSDYTIVVHNQQQADEYAMNPSIDPGRIAISNEPGDAFGLTRQREWVCENLVEPDEWFIFADDNIRAIKGVAPEHYYTEQLPVQDGRKDYWREVYDSHIDTALFMEIAQECRQQAKQVGARMCGFALVDNYYFRGRKWSTLGYVIGKLLVVQNAGVPYDHTITMEDFNNTAEHLLRYGRVLINRYVWPEAGHYERGGMGTYEERVEHRRRDCQLLLAKYPGLLKLRDRKGFEPGTELTLAVRSEQQLERWRAEMRVAA